MSRPSLLLLALMPITLTSCGLSAFDTERDGKQVITDLGREPNIKKGRVESIDLGSSKLTDAQVAKLVGLKKAQWIHVGRTAITDAALTHFATFPEAYWVELDETAVTDAGMKDLIRMSKLGQLSLTRTKITDAGMKELKHAGALAILNVSDTGVTDAGLAEFRGHPKLWHLVADRTPVRGTSIGDLSLTSVSLAESAVDDTGMRDIGRSVALKALTLNKTKITDAGLAQLKGCRKLNELHLDDTPIKGRGFAALVGLDLQRLTVVGAAVDDEGLKAISQLGPLVALDLTETKITDAGLPHLAAHENVEWIVLNKNKLSKSAVDDLRKKMPLTKIEWYDENE